MRPRFYKSVTHVGAASHRLSRLPSCHRGHNQTDPPSRCHRLRGEKDMNTLRLCRCFCSIGLALASLPALAAATSFIGPLNVTPGPSTVPANGDVNPYGVAVVP